MLSSTPACDGERVFVVFLDGTEMVVAAYDFEGKQQWLMRPGKFYSMHGFLQFADSFQRQSDRERRPRWRRLHRGPRPRDRQRAVAHRPSQQNAQLYGAAHSRHRWAHADDSHRQQVHASYDPNNGKLHWIMDGPTEQFVASPVFSERDDLVVITAGFPEYHTLAIKADGNGKVGAEKIAWRTIKGAVYVPSPIIDGNYFFIISEGGVAHCFETKTGKILWQERLGTHHTSLVSANHLIYFLNDNGVMNVVKAGPEFERVAQNEISEKTFASPAISDGQMFIRGDKHLFCISEW